MKFSKADAAFTAAVLAGIALLSVALHLHNRPRSAGSGEVIGKVFYKREIAMRKFSDRMVWEDVENGTPLYAHDAVMTGNYSDAELVLNNGLRLKLEANTLIELDLGSGELNLKLAGGGIKATGSAGARTKITTADGQAISVNDASASIRSTGSQTSVEVSSGQVAVVNKDGATQTVAANEVLAAGQKSRVTLQLSGIAEDAVIMTSGSSAKVSINCAGDAEAVEFSQRPDMQSVRIVRVSDNQVTTSLPPGDWYSRCRGKDNALSSVRHFRILRAGAYRVLQPDSVVTYREIPQVRFEFISPRGVTRTRLEIAANARFDKPVFSQELDQAAAGVTLPQAGKWYYRLTPLGDAVNNVSQLTPLTGSFQLQQEVQKKQLAFVTVAEPVFPIAQVQAGKALVYYEGSGTYRYEIMPRGRDEIVARGETNSGSVKLPQNLKGGKYELRLSAGNEKASLNFAVRERIAIELTTPQDGTVIRATPGTQTAVLPLAWRVSEDVSLFEVILAADAELKRVLRRLNVEQREFRFTGLKPGRYYIKVLALEDNVPRAETKTLAVKIEDRLPPVSGVFPKDDAKVDVTRTDGLQLRWQPVAGANSYEVRLLQKRKGALVPVQTLVTSKPGVVFSDIRKLNEGEVVWEVSARHVDASGKVLQQSEPVRSSVNISFGAAPPAPEIVPIVEE
jgi:hypothetical protein